MPQSPTRPPTSSPPPDPSTPTSSHPKLNIQHVILGTHLLTPWFPSEYPSGLVRDPPPPSRKSASGKLRLGTKRRAVTTEEEGSIWDVPEEGLEVKNVAGRKEREGHGPVGAGGHGAGVGEGERQRVGSAERLFVCEYCFAYSVRAEEVLGHRKFCEVGKNKGRIGKKVWDRPAGDYEIWEVHGEQHKLFCQNLSLFSKLFVANKSISYDVDSFLFYLLLSTSTSTIVGYFSKERLSWDDYNLACILVFPPYMRSGLGSLMISFSYELSRREGKVGSPEKPLSELGRRGYLSYWCSAVAEVVLGLGRGEAVDVRELSRRTGMSCEDVVAALREMGVVGRADGDVWLERRRVREWVERRKKKGVMGAEGRGTGVGSNGGGVGRKRVRAA